MSDRCKHCHEMHEDWAQAAFCAGARLDDCEDVLTKIVVALKAECPCCSCCNGDRDYDLIVMAVEEMARPIIGDVSCAKCGLNHRAVASDWNCKQAAKEEVK